MNLDYFSSTEFKSMRVGVIIHGSSFKDRHFVWYETFATYAKVLLKLDSTINTCLMRLNNILCYSLSLNTRECLISQIYQ